MSRLLSIPLGAAGAIALTIFGCGGIDGADGLFDSGSAGAGGAPSSTSVATGSPTATTSTTSTTGATSTSASTTTSSTTASSSVTSGASTSASGSSSSTGGIVDTTLDCGGVMCPLGNQNACCWSKFAMPKATGVCVQGPPDSDGCKTFVANDGLQARLECQTSAQCDQGTCCGHRTFFNGQNFFYDLVSCVDTCDASDVTLCDPANPADICPMIQTQGGPVQGVCKQSGSLPPGYFVCSLPG